MMNITRKQMKALLKAQQGELDAVIMYKKLAEQISDPKIGARLMEIAKDEGRHAAVFERLTHKRLPFRKFGSYRRRILHT